MNRLFLILGITAFGYIGSSMPSRIYAEEKEKTYTSEYIRINPQEVWLTNRGILLCKNGRYYKLDCIKHVGNGRYEVNGMKYIFDNEFEDIDEQEQIEEDLEND